jgi:hypothetical protein
MAKSYVAKAGDSWYSLAQKLLGDGRFAHALREQNKSAAVKAGQTVYYEETYDPDVHGAWGSTVATRQIYKLQPTYTSSVPCLPSNIMGGGCEYCGGVLKNKHGECRGCGAS